MTAKTAEQSFARLREIKDEAFDALEGADVARIAGTILQAGYHPYAAGRALTEILVRRHRDQKSRPLVPEVTQSDVVQLGDELGLRPQFDPTRRLEI